MTGTQGLNEEEVVGITCYNEILELVFAISCSLSVNTDPAVTRQTRRRLESDASTTAAA